MSHSRFFLEPACWQERAPRLTGDEAHHCARVRRHRPGDEVELFDGAGRVALARVTELRRDAVTLVIESESRHPPLPWRVQLLPALIKGEAFEWLLEKAVELGAASVRPVLTANTVARWDAAQAEKKLAKWRRHMLEAAKQCHTPFLPELRPPQPFALAVSQTAAETGTLRLVPSLFGDTRPLAQALESWGKATKTAFVLTGPEGDFTREELALAVEAGFQPVCLGPLILRAETAALTTLGVLGQWGMAAAREGY